MRQPTKRRTYGKAAIASALRCARNELVTALGQYSDIEPPEVSAMRRVATDLTNALKAYDIYGMQGKRLRATLLDLQIQVTDALNDVMGMPITQEEKTIARHKKVEERAHEPLKKSRGEKKPPVKAKQVTKKPSRQPEVGRRKRPASKAARPQRTGRKVP